MINRSETTIVDLVEDEWLWGWDPTPGIVSVWAEADGRALVWRRHPATGELVREDDALPAVAAARLDSTTSGTSATRSRPTATPDARVTYRELDGPGRAALSRVAPTTGATLTSARAATARRGGSGRRVGHLRELGRTTRARRCRRRSSTSSRPGRTYFRDLVVRPAAPPAVRSRDDRPRSRARPHLHGRGARSRRRDRGARGARRRTTRPRRS